MDKRTNKVKIFGLKASTTLIKNIIIGCIVGQIGLSVWFVILQYNDDQNRAIKVGGQIDEIRTTFNQSFGKEKRDLSAQITDVRSNLTAINTLRNQYDSLVQYAMTNININSDARQNLINSDEKYQDLNARDDNMNDWLTALRGKFRDQDAAAQIQHEKEVRQKQSDYQKLFHCANYLVNSLTNMVGKIAILDGDKIDSNFNGLPSAINPDDLLQLAEIKLKKTQCFDFQITWHPYDSTLYVTDGDSRLAINCNGGGELVIPNLPSEDFQFSLDDFKQPLHERLMSLIAYQDYIFSNTNK